MFKNRLAPLLAILMAGSYAQLIVPERTQNQTGMQTVPAFLRIYFYRSFSILPKVTRIIEGSSLQISSSYPYF